MKYVITIDTKDCTKDEILSYVRNNGNEFVYEFMPGEGDIIGEFKSKSKAIKAFDSIIKERKSIVNNNGIYTFYQYTLFPFYKKNNIEICASPLKLFTPSIEDVSI